MKRERGEHGLRAPVNVSLCPGAGRATDARATDLDLLRLSCVCRADARLLGQPERSRVLASIHRFFDRAPSGAALDELLFSALADAAPEASHSSRPE